MCVITHLSIKKKDEQVVGGPKVYTKNVSLEMILRVAPALPRPLPCCCPTPAAQRLGESIKAVL